MHRMIVGVISVFAALCALDVHAYEVDAAQRELAEKNRDRWQTEDRAIRSRLERHVREHGRPNVLFILADDIGWGELGSYMGGKLRGTPTPALDRLAAEGMKFLQHYSEPSCTPTRAALMTGRLPVRTGVDEILFPGQVKGLAAEEKTLAEVLSEAGYRTGLFGKWHLGESPEHQPAQQGFDYALYTLFNGGPWPWRENSQYFDAENEIIQGVPYELDMPQDYEQRFGIALPGIQEATRGKAPREIAPMSLERYNRHELELADSLIRFIEESTRSRQPFFAYYATNANQVFACPPEERKAKYVDAANCQAAQLAQHDKAVHRVVEKLQTLGIERNTLVIWASDNGPMYHFHPSAGFSYLRGRKSEILEGGVRTPAFARWPGMIAPGQDPLDLVHVTDWFTTIARVAGAEAGLPEGRVIDGVDQTSLLLNGEDHSRRDYVFYYRYEFRGEARGAKLTALRIGNIKLHLPTGDIYNIMRDPREEFSMPAKYLWANMPFRRYIYEHQKLMEKFPNRVIEETAGARER